MIVHCANRQIAYIPSLDPINVHGALVALKEVVSLLGNEDDKRVTVCTQLDL